MPKHETPNILLNNMGSKYSLLMKFGQFMSYYKRKNFIKNILPNSFVCKELSTTSTGKRSNLLILDM